MGHRLPIVRRILDVADANVLVLSYRGYGESEGIAEESGVKLDAQAAFDYLLSKARNGEIDDKKIILYGQSIGGAVAIDLAARNQEHVAGIIVENTFTSLRNLIPNVMPLMTWFRWLCHQRWESYQRLQEMLVSGDQMPRILFLSGVKDELVPPRHMQELFALVEAKQKDCAKIKFFDKGTHNDTCLQPGYFEELTSFVREFS